MSVKIRLSRGGTKKRPYYYVVVADSASPRDGRYIEQVGTHNPLLPKDNADRVKLDVERIKHWLSVGAQPTEQVTALLKLTGDWGTFKGDKNAVSTVKTKEAKVEFVADEKKKPVLKPKAEKPAPVVEEAAAVVEAEVEAEEAAEAEVVEAAEEITEAAADGEKA